MKRAISGHKVSSVLVDSVCEVLCVKFAIATHGAARPEDAAHARARFCRRPTPKAVGAQNPFAEPRTPRTPLGLDELREEPRLFRLSIADASNLVVRVHRAHHPA